MQGPNYRLWWALTVPCKNCRFCMVVPSTHAQTTPQKHHKIHTKTTRRPRAKLGLPKVAVGRGGLSSVREASGPRLDRVGVHLTGESSRYYSTILGSHGNQIWGVAGVSTPRMNLESQVKAQRFKIQTAVFTISVTVNPNDKL